MTIYYAAVKWPRDVGPQPREMENDLQILAMTLIAEWDWSLEAVEDALNAAIDAAQEQAMELDERERNSHSEPQS